MRINRLDKYTKTVLIVIALSVLALPVKAEEKIWYCQMTGFVGTSDDGAKNYKEERFKFKITPKEVVFGSGGYLHNDKMNVTIFNSLDSFTATDSVSLLIFLGGRLHLGVATWTGAKAMSARCDEF